MRALRLQEFDGTDGLTEETLPRPDPDDDQLLVEVHAAGVNPLDWLVCEGAVPELVDGPLPWTPGWDVSGVVESVGRSVSGFEVGDAVCGMARLPEGGGGFAEYTTMTAKELTRKPESLSHTEAAGVPMAGQTAFHALFDVASIEPGQRVLVHAAAGGVGHLAVQFADNTGGEVIGTASGHNEEFVRGLGADEFVDYRTQQFEGVLDDVDVVLDAVGGQTLERSMDVVAPGGTVVTLPERPPEETVEQFRARRDAELCFFDVILDSPPSTLQSVAARIDAGVEPTISGTYRLSELKDALEESADGHVRGKLVVEIA